MRHDPDPGVLLMARTQHFGSAVDIAHRLSTGHCAPPEVQHKVTVSLDEIFGAYHNCEIACTSPAAQVLVAVAKMTSREAELVSDMWLQQWRDGRNKNCPAAARVA